jgi:hypothetical protein
VLTIIGKYLMLWLIYLCAVVTERAMAHCGSQEVLIVGGVGCKCLTAFYISFYLAAYRQYFVGTDLCFYLQYFQLSYYDC